MVVNSFMYLFLLPFRWMADGGEGGGQFQVTRAGLSAGHISKHVTQVECRLTKDTAVAAAAAAALFTAALPADNVSLKNQRIHIHTSQMERVTRLFAGPC